MRARMSVRIVCCAAVALGALPLAGCGGSSAGGGSLTGSVPAASNKSGSVSLSGSPPSTVTVGQNYSFTPSVTKNSGTVVFSIKNAPTWATFNSSTGTLTGTPPAAAAGIDSNIVITATDGTVSAVLGPFSIDVAEVGSGSGTVQISWTPPTTATDGSTLTDLAGYEIFYGTNPSALTQMVNVPNIGVTSYTISSLTSGTWYFAVTSYTTDGMESEPSNVVTTTIA